MDITIKESLYLTHDKVEYIVRAGSVGVERNKIVYFYDNTRTNAVGFPRDFCLENPQIFQVSRVITDRDVSVKDVLKVIEESNLPTELTNDLYARISSL